MLGSREIIKKTEKRKTRKGKDSNKIVVEVGGSYATY